MTLESLSVSRGGCNEALSDLLFIGALNITTALVASPLLEWRPRWWGAEAATRPCRREGAAPEGGRGGR